MPTADRSEDRCVRRARHPRRCRRSRRSRWTSGRVALALLLAAALAPTHALAASSQSDPRKLKRLSLEELMALDVTSVSKRSEPLSGAAAAITVLTADDIRRSGAVTLPQLLRLATGLSVARFDSRTYAISARGFNITTANKLLVLIDGRSVYTPLFSGVFWDAQDVFLGDVERVEVIRGPGAALWGANAVNGVINVITKRAQDTQGGVAGGGGGTETRAVGGARWGGRLAGGQAWRTYLKYRYEDGLAFADGSDARDPLRRGQGGFRLDGTRGEREVYNFEGDLYSGLIGHAVFDDTDIHGGNLVGHWTRKLAGGSELALQAWYDHTYRRVPAQFEESRDTVDVEAQHRVTLGKHEVLWGGGYRVSTDDVGTSALVTWVPRSRTLELFSLFAQDEIALQEHLHLTLASRFEVDDYSGFQAQPTVRLAWTPSPRQTVWGAVSRAVRTPTRIDTDVRFTNPASGAVIIAGSEDFRAEEVVAFELGWRVQPERRVSFDLALFHNSYDDLRSQEPTPGTIFPFVLANNLNAETAGLELAVRYQMLPWWRWYADVVVFDKDLSFDPGSHDPTGGLGEGNDPRQQYQLRSSLDLPGRLELDAVLRRIGELPSPRVPAYTELDLRLGWRARPDLDFTLVGRNLLAPQHLEFGSLEEAERSLSGRVSWRF